LLFLPNTVHDINSIRVQSVLVRSVYTIQYIVWWCYDPVILPLISCRWEILWFDCLMLKNQTHSKWKYLIFNMLYMNIMEEVVIWTMLFFFNVCVTQEMVLTNGKCACGQLRYILTLTKVSSIFAKTNALVCFLQNLECDLCYFLCCKLFIRWL
jgi:hypothetical protein